jgi:hypothetical protein
VGIFRANEADALAHLSGVSNDEWEKRWMAEIKPVAPKAHENVGRTLQSDRDLRGR